MHGFEYTTVSVSTHCSIAKSLEPETIITDSYLTFGRVSSTSVYEYHTVQQYCMLGIMKVCTCSQKNVLMTRNQPHNTFTVYGQYWLGRFTLYN